MISGTAPGRNARGRGNRELPLPFLDYELASASIIYEQSVIWQPLVDAGKQAGFILMF